MEPTEGFEPPTARLRRAALCPLSYVGNLCYGKRMIKLLNRVACFIGSPWGFYVTMAATLLCVVLIPFMGMVASTFALSVIAIILPALILVQQSAHDKALHLKLDDLIRATPADNRLRHIEKLTPEEIDKLDDGAP